jgi:hypothetical protein
LNMKSDLLANLATRQFIVAFAFNFSDSTYAWGDHQVKVSITERPSAFDHLPRSSSCRISGAASRWASRNDCGGRATSNEREGTQMKELDRFLGEQNIARYR